MLPLTLALSPLRRGEGIVLLALLTLSACDSRGGYVAEANALTGYCAHSRLAKWNVRASAAGSDCAVLLVETDIILEDSMVDAMHRGSGAYDMYEGGVGQYARERAFRGVAYKDKTGRIWRFGAAEDLRPCH